MAASNFTNLYNNGSWGYMGIGPMPAKGFTLTLTADSSNNLFSLGACTSTHIVAYNPNNTSQYAVYSGTSFTVYGSGAYELVRYPANATPSTQSITIDYDPSNWDFHGLASLEGAALCIATDASGSAPDGHDYASIATAKKNMFTYEVIVVLMADKIDGHDIYAKRAEQDKDGNDIVPIPSVTGNGGKVLTVNSGATGTEWTNFTQIEVVAAMPANPTSGVLYIVTGS